jgi:cell division transport system permease protein
VVNGSETVTGMTAADNPGSDSYEAEHMIYSSIYRALQDIRRNRALNLLTLITISMSVLITNSFILFFFNTEHIMNAWKEGVRIMAYLKPEIPKEAIPGIRETIQNLYGVREARFVSREEAMNMLKFHMKRQSAILENLRNNPLPDAFEIRMIASTQTMEKIEALAIQVERLALVEEVEYGQRWIGKFIQVFHLFRMAGYAMITVFLIAGVFIIANTIRLVIYSRREEVEIMRLVGATDWFIKMPFYVQGIIHGFFGGVIGTGILYLVFFLMLSRIEGGIGNTFIQPNFLSGTVIGVIVSFSTMVGWLGCHLSLRQYLKS